MPKDNNHDSLFKLTFSHTKEARALIKTFLPTYISDALDLDSLHLENVSYVNEQLKEYFADIIYSCRTRDGKKSQISFLLEHKSYFDKGLPIQLLRYLTEGYSFQYYEDNSEKLKFILPVLIYHGDQKWKKIELLNIVDVPLIQLDSRVPTFDYEVIDLKSVADKIIFSVKRGLMLRTTLQLFKYKNDKQYILQNPTELFTFVEYDFDLQEKKKILRIFMRYIFRVHAFEQEEFRDLTTKLDDMTQAVAGSLWDALIEQGVKQGVKQGAKRGAEKENKKLSTLNAVHTLIRVFRDLPEYSDVQAANFVRATLVFTKQLRKLLLESNAAKARKVVLQTFFKDIELSKEEKKDLLAAIDSFYSKKEPSKS